MSLVETVQKIAALSRIELKEGEDQKLAAEIESILKYVSDVQEASGDELMPQAGALRNVMREDDSPTESGTHTEVLLSAAPSREGQYVKVKKIL
jgi:aspartyl/glutamyl-tRNA(Asn/Gln) amidotransferase C subunit